MPQVIPALISYGVQAATVGALGTIGSGIAGAIAGGLVASMLAPKQKSEGPRLGDLQVQSSSYGTVIPYALGTPRLAGQVIWASAKKETKVVTESGGKGGGGQESTSYTYKVDLLILLTSNVQSGISRVWMNGGLIWNKSSSASAETIAASDSIPQWESMTFYNGSATQGVDPIYEAAVGTANCSANRGRATVMLANVDLGSSGNIPNFTFEFNNDPVLAIGAEVQVAIPASGIDAVGFSSTKFLVERTGASNYAYRTLGQVVGGVASVGSSSNQDTATTNNWNSVDRLSDTKIICIWGATIGPVLNAAVITNTSALASSRGAITLVAATSNVSYVVSLTATTAVVLYQLGGWKAAVLSIDGSDNVTVGSEYTGMAAETTVTGLALVRLSDTQAMAFWLDSATNPSPLRGVVLTVSGTSLSGTVTNATNPLAHDMQYNPQQVWRRGVALSGTTVLYHTRQATTLYPRVVALTVSGANFTIGTGVNLGSTASDGTGALAKINSGYALATYLTGGNNIKARVVGIGYAGAEHAIASVASNGIPVVMSPTVAAVVYRDTASTYAMVKPVTLT